MLNPFCTTALRTRIGARLRNATLCLGLLAASATTWAVPVTWYLSNVKTVTGKTVTGSFVYDADTDTYSAINLASGANTYTQFSRGNARYLMAVQAPIDNGQPGVFLQTQVSKTNAGGVLNLTTIANTGGLSTCSSAACGGLSPSPDLQFASGTITTTPPVTTPASVPTLGEWALMLLVVLMGWVGMGGVKLRGLREPRDAA